MRRRERIEERRRGRSGPPRRADDAGHSCAIERPWRDEAPGGDELDARIGALLRAVPLAAPLPPARLSRVERRLGEKARRERARGGRGLLRLAVACALLLGTSGVVFARRELARLVELAVAPLRVPEAAPHQRDSGRRRAPARAAKPARGDEATTSEAPTLAAPAAQETALASGSEPPAPAQGAPSRLDLAASDRGPGATKGLESPPPRPVSAFGPRAARLPSDAPVADPSGAGVARPRRANVPTERKLAMRGAEGPTAVRRAPSAAEPAERAPAAHSGAAVSSAGAVDGNATAADELEGAAARALRIAALAQVAPSAAPPIGLSSHATSPLLAVPPAPAPSPGAPSVAPSPAHASPRAAYPSPLAPRPLAPPPLAPAWRPEPAPTATRGTLPHEARLLGRAVAALRRRGDAHAALTALDEHGRAHPGGQLAEDALLVRAEALFSLGRLDDALALLESEALDAGPRAGELRLARAELRARRDCARALADFDAAEARAPALAERAVRGRALCRLRLGSPDAAATELRGYLARFPHGAFAAEARARLDRLGSAR